MEMCHIVLILYKYLLLIILIPVLVFYIISCVAHCISKYMYVDHLVALVFLCDGTSI